MCDSTVCNDQSCRVVNKLGQEVENEKNVKNTPFELEVNLDGYNRDEIVVTLDKTIRTITIEANHTVEGNNNFLMKQFTRKLTIPEDYKFENLKYEINSGLVNILIPYNNEDNDFDE